MEAEELERERLTLLERVHDPLTATADEDVDEAQRLLQGPGSAVSIADDRGGPRASPGIAAGTLSFRCGKPHPD